jgi:hypothetical protein
VTILRPDGLTLETTLVASSEGPGPVIFGFHLYIGLPELLRANWKLELSAAKACTRQVERRTFQTLELVQLMCVSVNFSFVESLQLDFPRAIYAFTKDS